MTHRGSSPMNLGNSSTVKISIVCPTFNSAGFIERTLATVLAQSRLPDELVISDDGSSDDTVEVVERYLIEHCGAFPWRVLRNPHRGPGATRNAGIRGASESWVAFLDSDDLWEVEKLERVEAAIVANPRANFFCHDETRIDKGGRASRLEYGRRYRDDRPLPPQLYFANMFSTSAVVCRRDLLLVYDGFDESLMSAQDYELWLRLSPSLLPSFIGEMLGKYMEREGNITSGKLFKRMSNELRIAWMHRAMVSPGLVVARIVRIALSYTRQYFVARRA
jgi:glycosyltransferase involved in cell wall biosynthesis